MKARLPKGYNSGAGNNIQQLAKQAQKMQKEMEEATNRLEDMEYKAASGGGAVEAVVSGKLEIKSLKIDPEVIIPSDAEMLSDLVIAAVNEALRKAESEKEETMNKISGGLNIPGLF